VCRWRSTFNRLVIDSVPEVLVQQAAFRRANS
jgi:hypothetical protein